ncbi:MAG: RecX family transcriptional regulator [Bacteroidales bacterium]|nr:RecX family transcriptional regulator [Bacteroidales bacterium]
MKDKEVYSKMAAMCSKQEYCIDDIQKKLDKYELSNTSKQDIISALQKENFLNEERYATAFVRDKFLFNKWGKVKISYHLKIKHITGEIINTALDSINETDYFQIARTLASQKMKQMKLSKLDYTHKQKVMRFLFQRGFESNIINTIVDEL